MANSIEIPDTDDEIEFLDTANSIPHNAHINNNNTDKYYYAKKSKRDNVVGAWQPCELLERIECIENPKQNVYVVKFIRNQEKKDVPEYELASRWLPHNLLTDLSMGTRVIARRDSNLLPYQMNETGQKNWLLDSISNEFYPGIIAGYDQSRYLVFFDDGCVQLVKILDLRRVLGNDQCHHAHWNAKLYFDWYLRNERLEARPSIHQIIKVELNGNCEALAKVIEIDSMLAKIHFENVNRYEWIYLGSPRIYCICRALIKQKRLDNMIHYKTYTTCLSANDDVVMIDFVETPNKSTEEVMPVLTPKCDLIMPSKHDCCHLCVRLEDMPDIKIEEYGAFQRPLLTGWKRFGKEKKFYAAPCGVFLHSLNDVDRFLFLTDSKLRIDCFDFSKDCEISLLCRQTISKTEDISHGIERMPTTVCGQMSLEDKSFNYTKSYNYEFVGETEKNLGRSGCNCTDNCRDKLKCSCWQLTLERLIERTPKNVDLRNNAKVGYKHMRLMEIVYTGIVECGDNCKCCANTCVNRVVQNGMQHKLEVFMTKDRGWGLRATTDIPEAMFVCNYAGDLLEDSVADKRSTKYQFRLPKFRIDYDDTDSDSDDEPEPKRQRSRSHDVIQPFLNYFPPSMQNGNANHFPEPDHSRSSSKSYVVDALYHGNMSRFINHSCDPNLFVQSVYVDEDKRFPWLGFFSSEPIKAGQELTIDYRYDLIEGEETECLCGSGAKCRKRLT